jgi:hypothetical protein
MPENVGRDQLHALVRPRVPACRSQTIIEATTAPPPPDSKATASVVPPQTIEASAAATVQLRIQPALLRRAHRGPENLVMAVSKANVP